MANIDQFNTYSSAQVALPLDVDFAATITLNMVNANNFNISTPITSNFTIANPTNLVAGSVGYIRVQQDGTGGYQPSFGSSFYFAGGIPAEIIDPLPNAISTIEYRVASPTEIHVGVNKGWVNS